LKKFAQAKIAVTRFDIVKRTQTRTGSFDGYDLYQLSPKILGLPQKRILL